MERIRNMKNRLSLSVDKLTTVSVNNEPFTSEESNLLPLNSKSTSPTCDGTQPQREPVTEAPSCPRLSSTAGGTSVIVTEVDPNKLVNCEPNLGNEVSSPDSLNQSYDCFKGFPETLKDNNLKSFMDEIMSEVNKLSSDPTEADKVEKKPLKEKDSESALNNVQDANVNRTLKQNEDKNNSQHVLPSATKKPDTPDLQIERLTSGYFSDSASDGVKSLYRKRERKPKITNQISQKSPNEPVPVERKKKEGIYSKLKRATKRDASASRPSKEPIYARIRPKLKNESDFRPINPNISGNTTNQNIVKPEPIYNRLKIKDNPRYTISAIDNVVPITSDSHESSFTPVSSLEKTCQSPTGIDKTIKMKTKSLPFEPFYKRLKKKEISSLDDDSKRHMSELHKQHIYTQPLPAIPDKPYQKRVSSVASPDYGKVKIKAKEILSNKAKVITINNPGYAKPNDSLSLSRLSRSTASPTTVSSPCSSVSSFAANSLQDRNTKTPEDVDKITNCTAPKDSDAKETETRLVDSAPASKDEVSNKDQTSERPHLSRIVKELAEELESVTQRTGLIDEADDISKREVLMKLLSTYAVPKSLRRVDHSSQDGELDRVGSLIPSSISPDELRFVDDSVETMIYSDVPDYSQDEFIIALDDVNDPKYASLTQEMRRQAGGADSPGRVSRRSAQVYVNVINVISALKVLINSNSTKAVTVINKMGTLARPYAQKMSTSIGDTQWIQRKIYHKSGHNGFDELRRYIKSGGEFCKELAVVMHERAELETSYAKGLHKLSSKLVKASRETLGSVSEAWQTVGAELQHEGDIHRLLASTITEDVVRPLRHLIETQHKIRKGVETIVDKTTKNLYDWRGAEAKSKKNSFHNNRENEKIQQIVMEARMGKGKILSDKDFFKLEKQKRKAEDAVEKSNHEYYTFCVKAERARQEWESAVYRGSSCFQTLEEERLSALKELVEKYYTNMKEIGPKLASSYERLEEPVGNCDVGKDIVNIIAAKGTGQNNPEQQLPDFYAEDFNTAMNTARRREALEKFNKTIRTDLEREKRGKQGIENLAKALQETPNFGGEDSQQDVNDKLQHMKAMLAYLEASRYKVQRSLDELTNKPRNYHALARHVETCRDKQGILISILKVPPWVRSDQSSEICSLSDSPETSPDWNDRGSADGNSMQPESDFAREQKASSFMCPARYPSLTLPTDEFSSQGSDHDYLNALNGGGPCQNDVTKSDVTLNGDASVDNPQNVPDGTYYAQPLTAVQASGRCKALYDYEANMYDELSIKTGDIINIHEKQPDGWWVGELDGIIGIFPATYVEEIDFTN